jgi:DNA-binding NtrC family response regulator
MANSSPALVGESATFRAFRARLQQVAPSDATVLIRGESGCGKELAARALHDASRRAGGPFVPVHIAALAPALVESELFGHEEGAFTGAHRARQGRFRQADGGTLLLDDVDALGLDVQSKLLRVLQERAVEPVGGERPLPVDVRVLATTQRDLAEEVEAGRFRADLFWRLSVVPLDVPPLRARLDDLPSLAGHLIDRLVAGRRLKRRALSDGALAALRRHTWPGNVRELENALERALVLAPPGDPPPPIEAGELDSLAPATCSAADDVAARALASGLRLEDVERALLERALADSRGNLSAAARRVGLTRRAFEYRLARARGQGGEAAERPAPDLARGSDRA